MTLVPISKRATQPIFKSNDPEFDHDAAQRAYDLIMKMDEDEAQVFAQIVAADVTEEIIEKNLTTVQRHLDVVVKRRAHQIKKALAKQVKEGSEEALAYAHSLSLFEKNLFSKAKNPYDYGYVWRESDFNRDPQTGQFKAKIKHTQKKPIREDMAISIVGTKTPTTGGRSTRGKAKKLTPADRAKFQDEYRQLAVFLDTVERSTQNGLGNNRVMLRFEDKAGNQHSVVHNTGMKSAEKYLADPDLKLVSAEVRPETLNVGGAAFGLAGALGGSMTQDQVRRTNAGAQEFSRDGGFAQEWTRDDYDERNSNARTYNRIQAGSSLVNSIAPEGSKLQIAAAFGEFAGSMGPQAESVIGPSARKTAYRYRGTEKTPDAAIAREYGAAVTRAKTAPVYSYEQSQTGRSDKQNLSQPAMVQLAARRIQAERRNPTFDEVEAGRAVVVEGLKKKLPNTRLAQLQLASGNTPPSEGILINAEGQITTQAVGYADDHYLPFNLKNLKELKGGQYIRTRSFGGLTSEDIYTGLMTGARQITVVSHSGVYTLTFDDELRGGRRHNDKARRMTRRYEQILDAVQSEQVDARSVDPLIKAEIRRKVKEENPGESASTIRALVKEAEEEYKENPDLADEDEVVINRLMMAARGKDQSFDADEYRRQVTTQILASKRNKFRLDGHGYGAALDALAEQFPYYITVKYGANDLSDEMGGGIDRGYVEPGRNRPTQARVGRYGTEINQGNKRGALTAANSASHADYQGQTIRNTKTGTQNTPEGSSASAASGAGSPAGTTGTTGTAGTTNKKKTQTIQQKRALNQAAAGLWVAFRGGMLPEQVRSNNPDIFKHKTADEFDDWVSNPENAAKFTALVEQAEQNAKGSNVLTPEGQRLFDDFNRARGSVGEAEYDDQMAFTWPKNPSTFGGPAYKPDADATTVRIQANILDTKYGKGIMVDKKLSEMTESEMREEIKALRDINYQISSDPSLKGKDSDAVKRRREMLAGLRPDYSPESIELITNERKLLKKASEIHRMRTLKARGKLDIVGDPVQTAGVAGNSVPTAQPAAQPEPVQQPNSGVARQTSKHFKNLSDSRESLLTEALNDSIDYGKSSRFARLSDQDREHAAEVNSVLVGIRSRIANGEKVDPGEIGAALNRAIPFVRQPVADKIKTTMMEQ